MLEIVINIKTVVFVLAIVHLIFSLILAGAYAVGWKHISEGASSVIGSLFSAVVWILVILAVT